MIFGNKKKIAIESKKESNKFCRICMWIDDCSVGDFSAVVLTGALIESLLHFIKNKSLRRDDKLFLLKHSPLVNQVYDAVFSDNDLSLEESLSLLNKYGSFVFSPGIAESFDEDTIVVVSSGDSQRVIWKSLVTNDENEVILNEGYIEQILNSCISWLQQ